MIIDKKYNPVDVHVGMKLRKKRLESNISQEELGNAIGITFQQVQKYEKGLNRISSRVLYHISRIFNLNIEYFFHGLPEHNYETLTNNNNSTFSLAEPKNIYGIEKEDTTYKKNGSNHQDKHLTKLIEIFQLIKNPEIKEQIIDIAKLLSKK